MSKQNMSAKQLEDLIKQKTEIDNKEALEALKTKQREELKQLRAELEKKKRQEKAQKVNEVGKYFMGKFKGDLTTEQYIEWVDKLCACWRQNHAE